MVKFALGAEAPVGLKPASRDELIHCAVHSRTFYVAGSPFGCVATLVGSARGGRSNEGSPHSDETRGLEIWRIWSAGKPGERALPRQNFPDEQQQGSGPGRILGHIRRRLPKGSASSLRSRLSTREMHREPQSVAFLMTSETARIPKMGRFKNLGRDKGAVD